MRDFSLATATDMGLVKVGEDTLKFTIPELGSTITHFFLISTESGRLTRLTFHHCAVILQRIAASPIGLPYWFKPLLFSLIRVSKYRPYPFWEQASVLWLPVGLLRLIKEQPYTTIPHSSLVQLPSMIRTVEYIVAVLPHGVYQIEEKTHHFGRPSFPIPSPFRGRRVQPSLLSYLPFFWHSAIDEWLPA